MIATEIRPGAYYDSVVLMQVQRALCALNGIQDAAVVMGLPANIDLLRQSNLYTAVADDAGTDDLIIAVRAANAAAAEEAIGQFDKLLVQRTTSIEESDYLPKTLSSAERMLPDAAWVLVSVPGRYAASVAEEALMLDKHVFLYSDNVSIDDEVHLKQLARRRSLLVMGPDCGTAIINGAGLGFANAVRRGDIGIVSASGTGLQHVAATIHHLGFGVSHGLGTGGRDLSDKVGGQSTLQCLDLLAGDAGTKVIVLISKPPAPTVSDIVLSRASVLGKPVVVYLIGLHSIPDTMRGHRTLHFANSLEDAAHVACQLSRADEPQMLELSDESTPNDDFNPQQKFVRGIFSGGTLALECVHLLRQRGHDVRTILPDDGGRSGHLILDLGDDEYTVGRLHPILDNDLRIRQIEAEARDPETTVVLLDCILGYGAHPDPASELAPAIAQARSLAAQDGRHLEILVILIGTEEDPQDYDAQHKAFTEAGAHVFDSNAVACAEAARIVERNAHTVQRATFMGAILEQPFTAINVGLVAFAASIEAQGARVQHVDWRPPARGNERLMGILARMKR